MINEEEEEAPEEVLRTYMQIEHRKRGISTNTSHKKRKRRETFSLNMRQTKKWPVFSCFWILKKAFDTLEPYFANDTFRHLYKL